MRVLIAAVAASLATASAALAADFKVQGKVADVIVHGETAEALAQRLANAVLSSDQIAVATCAERVFVLKDLSTVDANDPLLQQVSKGRPIFHQRVEGSGCGAVRKHNVYLFDQGNAPIRLVTTLPGDTAASLKLQVDALQIVGPAAEAMTPKTCDQANAVVMDTKIVDKPDGRSPWSETWTFRKCKADVRFRLTYTPDATGVVISAKREN